MENQGDGFEVHFDSDRGWLSLSCGPDRFIQFRDFVGRTLGGFPEIDLSRIKEIEILNSAAVRQDADTTASRILPIGWLLGFAVIVALTVTGAVVVIRWIVGG